MYWVPIDFRRDCRHTFSYVLFRDMRVHIYVCHSWSPVTTTIFNMLKMCRIHFLLSPFDGHNGSVAVHRSIRFAYGTVHSSVECDALSSAACARCQEIPGGRSSRTRRNLYCHCFVRSIVMKVTLDFSQHDAARR